jgi:hypothetical protein
MVHRHAVVHRRVSADHGAVLELLVNTSVLRATGRR